MKRYGIYAIVAATLMSLLLTACGAAEKPAETTAETSAAETSAVTTEMNENESKYDLYADFTKGSAKNFEISNGWSNGSMFNCTWRKTNCVFEDEEMKLIIDKDADGLPIPYSAAEYRTTDFYSYGTYEVEMKPIKHDGVVSSFFTYTGPSDNNPWDEIDIEFLGKDTTKVQFNYFTSGGGGHEHIYDLGFDASEEYHFYGFRWTENAITWLVDGKEVYTAETKIPVTPSKIMMNVWPGTGVDGWLNAFDGTTPLTAYYRTVRFTAEK